MGCVFHGGHLFVLLGEPTFFLRVGSKRLGKHLSFHNFFRDERHKLLFHGPMVRISTSMARWPGRAVTGKEVRAGLCGF